MAEDTPSQPAPSEPPKRVLKLKKPKVLSSGRRQGNEQESPACAPPPEPKAEPKEARPATPETEPEPAPEPKAEPKPKPKAEPKPQQKEPEPEESAPPPPPPAPEAQPQAPKEPVKPKKAKPAAPEPEPEPTRPKLKLAINKGEASATASLLQPSLQLPSRHDAILNKRKEKERIPSQSSEDTSSNKDKASLQPASTQIAPLAQQTDKQEEPKKKLVVKPKKERKQEQDLDPSIRLKTGQPSDHEEVTPSAKSALVSASEPKSQLPSKSKTKLAPSIRMRKEATPMTVRNPQLTPEQQKAQQAQKAKKVKQPKKPNEGINVALYAIPLFFVVIGLMGGLFWYSHKAPEAHKELTPRSQALPGTVKKTDTPQPVKKTSPDLEVRRWVNNVSIQAIVGKGRKSKIFVGGKTYTAGSMIEPTLGITFVGADAQHVYFRDSEKRIYRVVR